MKKGTHVGLDKNYNNVCVGDQIKDFEGYIYTIDKYGKAVGKGGSSFQLSEIQPFELYAPAPEAPEPEQTDEKTKEQIVDEMFGPTRAEALEILTDQDLAEELRRRGYEVKATKTIIVAL